MGLSHEITIPIDLTGDLEFPIYAPPVNDKVVVEKITLVPGASAGKEAVNFTTLQILDKGAAGTSDDVISELKTEDVAEGVALTGLVKQDMSPTTPYPLNYAITISKEDAGAAIDLQESAIILKVRQNG